MKKRCSVGGTTMLSSSSIIHWRQTSTKLKNKENMFHIGQEVVAITNHPHNVIAKGKIYTVKSIMERCNCYQLIDVGVKTSIYSPIQKCCKCGAIDMGDGRYFLNANRFAPIISNEELQRLLNEIEEPTVACV